jgi:drug/metabolite transporter (DMT)-like permease
MVARPSGGAKLVFVPLALTLVFWASAFVAIRDALHDFGPGALALFRYLIASSVLTVYWLAAPFFTGRPRRLPRGRDVGRFLVFGLLGVTAYNIGLNFGERTVTAGTASFIVGQIPIFTTVMAFFILGERVARRAIVGVGIGFAGTVVLLFADRKGISFNTGTIFVIVAIASESLYFVLQKPVLERYRPIEISIFTTWCGTLLMIPFGTGVLNDLRNAGAGTIAAVAYLGVFPGALAYFLWSVALSRLTVFQTSTSLYFLPFLTIVIGVAWLGELPTTLGLVGGLVALTGAIVVNAQRLREHASEQAPTALPSRRPRAGTVRS